MPSLRTVGALLTFFEKGVNFKDLILKGFFKKGVGDWNYWFDVLKARFVTVDKMCPHCYDPESKRQLSRLIQCYR